MIRIVIEADPRTMVVQKINGPLNQPPVMYAILEQVRDAVVAANPDRFGKGKRKSALVSLEESIPPGGVIF